MIIAAKFYKGSLNKLRSTNHAHWCKLVGIWSAKQNRLTNKSNSLTVFDRD